MWSSLSKNTILLHASGSRQSHPPDQWKERARRRGWPAFPECVRRVPLYPAYRSAAAGSLCQVSSPARPDYHCECLASALPPPTLRPLFSNSSPVLYGQLAECGVALQTSLASLSQGTPERVCWVQPMTLHDVIRHTQWPPSPTCSRAVVPRCLATTGKWPFKPSISMFLVWGCEACGRLSVSRPSSPPQSPLSASSFSFAPNEPLIPFLLAVVPDTYNNNNPLRRPSRFLTMDTGFSPKPFSSICSDCRIAHVRRPIFCWLASFQHT